MVSESGFRPHSVCVRVCVFQDECVLEAALQERARILFQVLLQYITDLMMWEEGDELPGEIEPRLAKLLLLFFRYRYRSVFLHTKFLSNFSACLRMLQKCCIFNGK